MKEGKPAGGNGGQHGIFVSNWKAHLKNTLRGFLSLRLPSGLTIHNCTLHEKGAARWIGLPARAYRKDDGSTGYSPVVEFSTREARDRFQSMALEAVDHFMEARHE